MCCEAPLRLCVLSLIREELGTVINCALNDD